MTTSGSIKDFKKELMYKLVSSDAVIKAMGNDDIECNDEAVYKYIFPYFYIPYTIEEAHSYICMKVNMNNLANANEYIGNFSIIVWVISNQEIMKVEGIGGATRIDHMADLVEEILNGSEAFGIKRLQITSNTEEDLDMRHRCRKLVFSANDFSQQIGCGII